MYSPGSGIDGDGGMATQEMEVDMDTLLEEDVEDLGDLELDEAEEDEDEIEEAVPVAAAVEEEEMHPGLMAGHSSVTSAQPTGSRG